MNIALPLKRWDRDNTNDRQCQNLRRLRSLSLLDGQGNTFFFEDDGRPNLVRNLPPSLENLRVTMVSPVKVLRGFGPLTLNSALLAALSTCAVL